MIIEKILTPQRARSDSRPVHTPEMLELYQSIVEALPQSLFLFDENRYFIGIYNADPIILLDCKVEDVIGKHLDTFINDTSSPLHQICAHLDCRFEQVLKTGISQRFEYTTGSCYFETTVTKIKGNRILNQVRDITHIIEERQKIEHNKDNELAIALTAGGLIPWNYNVETQYFTSTQENNIIQTGLSFADMSKRLSPEYWKVVTEAFEQLISGEKKHCEFTILVRDKQGNPLWNNIHAVPHTYSPDGRVAVIIGSQKDITWEHMLSRKIENNRSKLAMAIRSSGLQLWEYTPQTDTIEIDSDCQSRKLKYATDFRKNIHPEDLSKFDRMIEEIITKQSENFELNMRTNTKGQYHWYGVNAAAFQAQDAPMTVIGLAKDITEEILATNELIELRNKAEEGIRLKTAFIANMSHEIRTPLNAIVGFSTMLATTDDPVEKKTYLEIVENNNALLLNLISDALDLSKLELGNMSFSFENIHIESLFNQLLSDMQSRFPPQVKLHCIIDEQAQEFITDRRSLIQIMTNFLTNAAKFTCDGVVTLGCTLNSQGVRFSVRDTGCGIPKERQSEIFERFVKLDNYTQGTGLGLSICQTIVKMLGGTIGVESELGKGSEFWCILPSIPEKQISFYIHSNEA